MGQILKAKILYRDDNSEKNRDMGIADTMFWQDGIIDLGAMEGISMFMWENESMPQYTSVYCTYQNYVIDVDFKTMCAIFQKLKGQGPAKTPREILL